MILPDEGHGARKRENRVLLLGASIAFLRDRLIGAGAGGATPEPPKSKE